MQYLRWEVLAPLRSFSLATETLLGVPMASGLIARENDDKPENRAPSDPITIPVAPEAGPFLLLRLEAMSQWGWIVTLAPPGSTPDPGNGQMDVIDSVPRILVPRTGFQDDRRSVEVRAVQPGSVFVARMWTA